MVDVVAGRLSLRCFERSDLPALLQLWGSAAVMRYVEDGSTMDAAAAEKELNRLIASYPARPLLGRRAVVASESGDVIGWGLVDRWEGTPAIEIGYGLRADLWGRGLGRSLAAGLLDYVSLELPDALVVATVHADNRPSIRILTRLGFTVAGVARREGREKLLYARGGTIGDLEGLEGAGFTPTDTS